jgi:hypothetical protein
MDETRRGGRFGELTRRQMDRFIECADKLPGVPVTMVEPKK